MSQSILLPAFAALFGVTAAIFLIGGSPKVEPGPSQTAPQDSDSRSGRTPS
jgi:hypothetical protein